MANSSAHLSLLQNFVQTHLPHVGLVTPTSVEYSFLRSSFSLSNSAAPLAIVRPLSIADVSSLVSFTTAHQIPVTVRSGGYSYFGSSFSQSALAIDLRYLLDIHLASDGNFATVGGGVLQGDLARELSRHGLMTPITRISSMGYVGWATYGGYGPFSAAYGLGVDQIVGVKIVDSNGRVRDSDGENEEGLLRAVRGGGGALGIIVELRIKVYPLQNILAGNIIFGTKDIAKTIQTFNDRYRELAGRGLPPQMTVQQMAFPNSREKLFGIHFMWASDDINTGRQYLARIESLAPATRNEVVVTTIPHWLDTNPRVISSGYGYPLTLNVRRMTPEIVAIISKHAKRIPSDSVGLSVQELRGRSAKPDLTSVFGSREVHFMIEILPIVAQYEDMEESRRWAEDLLAELRSTDFNNILEGTYISLTRRGDNSLSNIYGPNYGNLLELKWMYDPTDVFGLAIPQLLDRAT